MYVGRSLTNIGGWQAVRERLLTVFLYDDLLIRLCLPVAEVDEMRVGAGGGW